MSLMEYKMWLCGDYVDCYQCDQCGEEQVCSPMHWHDRNFTLCSNCLEAAYQDMFGPVKFKGPVYNRKPVTKVDRLFILKRDSYRCRYCGSNERLEADHVIPSSKGGSSEIDNLVTACRSCNSKKGAKTPEEAGMKLIAIHE